MLFRELNRVKCKTYLFACETSGRAALVDPVRDRIDRYLALLAYERLRLEYAVDTHTHADHRSGCFELAALTGARIVMHRKAPAPGVHVHVDEGDEIAVGEVRARVLATPGHTPDGLSLHVRDRVLTGDTLLVGGTGRCDFAGGNAGEQYDSITQKLFTLPDETLVFPAHDYRGHTHSTIGEEKRSNPRVAGRTRDAYITLMENLGMPLPEKIQEVLQTNQSAIEDDRLQFPSLSALNEVRQLSAEQVLAATRAAEPPLLLDVREVDEYTGELGHVAGSRLMPLRELTERVSELEPYRHSPIVAICRAGVRSTTASAILTALGFDQVVNLRGGMVEWNDRGLPVER